MNIRYLVAAVILAFAASPARAEFSGNVIRIGVLTDMSGVFADIEGPGSVVAAKLAADDFGNKIGSTPIEIISADHQNKAEIGSAIARKWLDSDGVDMITDLGLTVYLTDIDALGLEAAQGTVLSIPFYWDLNDQTRAYSKRFFEKHGKMPTAFQAAVYASVLHYLKTVAMLQSDEDGRAVVAKMKEIPTDDPVYGKGSIRIDGRKLHPLYLFQVKTPQESKGRCDYYKLVQTIPVEDAWKPLDPACSLVAKQ